MLLKDQTPYIYYIILNKMSRHDAIMPRTAISICLAFIAILVLLAFNDNTSNSGATTLASNATGTPQIKIINSYSHWNVDPKSPGLNIVGEVVNESPRIVTEVKIIATAYDSEDRVIGVAANNAAISTIDPGSKSPFGVSLRGTLMPLDQLSYYGLVVDWK